jgi:hypothetical protein
VKRPIWRFLGMMASLAIAGAAAADTIVDVPATSNIYGAGHAAAPAPGGGEGGSLPIMIDFGGQAVQGVTFPSVTGSIRAFGEYAFHGADGNEAVGGEILAYGGISGIGCESRSFFMVGVFLDGSEPADPPPTLLDFSPTELGTAFNTLSPQLSQQFFIGDGLTGTDEGNLQVFRVPKGATRLFLGFSDGMIGSLPGWYEDDEGSLTVRVRVFTIPVPGDTDEDGDVDLDDLNNFSDGWYGNLTPGWGTGDFDYDNDVDLQDLNLFSDGWYGPYGPGGGEVPEPGSAVLLAEIAVMGMICWRRRRA